MRQLALMLAGIAGAIAMSGCNNSGRSSQVTFTINPQQAPVILGQFTTGSGTIISPPWIQSTVQVDNNSDDSLTLVDLTYYITSMQNGSLTTSTLSVAPSDYNFAVPCTDGSTLETNYVSFGTFPAGSSGPLQLVASNEDLIIATCTGSGSGSNTITINQTNPVIYLGPLPAPTTTTTGPPNPSDYNYTLEFSPQGWFGTLYNVDSSFLNITYFSANLD